LNIKNNNLLKLAETLFHGLSSLRSVFLGGNTELGCRPPLPSQKVALDVPLPECFMCGDCIFYNDDGVLIRNDRPCNPTSCNTTLDVGGQNISAVTAETFRNLSSLRELRLHNNKITSLPGQVFQDLTSLRYLSISKNMLSSLPDDIFQSLTSLREL
jgi:Leucine-rich repeat (LRR) protein